jgi:putative PEP-CTERM system TPR-repeat lipoprotein
MLDLQERKPDDARKRYEQMLAKDPKNEQLLLAVAEVLANTKRPEAEVRAAIEKAIEAAPSSTASRLALVTYYQKLPDAKAALVAAQAAQSAFPNDPRVLEALGAAQIAAGERNQALDTFRQLSRLVPENPLPFMRIAETQVALKDYNGAIDTLQQLIKIKPDLVQAWIELAQVHVISGHPDSALAEARKLQKQQPDSAAGYAIEGEVLASQKKWQDAVAAYRNGLARQPLPLLAVRSYLALQNAGKSGEATALATKWMKDHPQDVVMPTFLGQQSLNNKDFRNAASNYRVALAIEPENIALLNNLAWTLIQLGDPKAVEVAEKAYVEAPNNPNVMDTLGWALVHTGDAAKGTELLRAASNLTPASDEIRLHLATALIKTGDKAAARLELEALIQRDKPAAIRDEASKLLEGL